MNDSSVESIFLHESISHVAQDLRDLILTISQMCSIVHDVFSSGGLYGVSKKDTFGILESFTGEENPSGEIQDPLDFLVNRYMVDRLINTKSVREVASEEEEEIREGIGQPYSVTLDPLDGSSNIVSNNLCGTIVGIYDGPLFSETTEMVCSLYCLYGPSTTLVLALKDGTVNEYVHVARENRLNPSDADEKHESGGEKALSDFFVLSRRDVRIPNEPKIQAIGALRGDWISPVSSFSTHLDSLGLKLRYGGAMVGDVHQVLHYGGIFSYPQTRTNPSGKLRLLFEAIPMSFIMEKAGGKSTNGTRALTSLTVFELHERTPVYLGTPKLIEEFETLYSKK